MSDPITTTTDSINIRAADGSGSFKAHVVTPSVKAAGAVVVIQEIFGVNASLRETCREVSEMGFIAVAPDLFWRQEPGVDITDKSEAEWKKAFALMNGFDQDKGVDDLKSTLAVARALPGCNGRAGTIGFCLGGRLAVMMATRSDADVNVSYYGVMLDKLVPEFGRIGHRLLVHIAEKDEYSSKAAREAVISGAAGNRHIVTHTYSAVQHAFARVNGVHYDRRAATIANGRTAEALAASLG
ncbi:MAG TPA: dienelactone hydrolase family protein [Acidiphilium sp.]